MVELQATHNPDQPTPLAKHLRELKVRLLIYIVFLAGAFGVCYVYAGHINAVLFEPLLDVYRDKGKEVAIIYTHLTEPFFVYVKVAFFCGVCFIVSGVVLSGV